MKTIKICLIIMSLILVQTSFAQTYYVQSYFNQLKQNLSTLESFDEDVQAYCKQKQQNINIVLTSENVVNLGFEQYQLSPLSQEYYDGFQNMKYLDKCRLLYSWNRVSENIIEIADQKKIPRGIAYLPIAFTALNEYFSSSDFRFGIWGLQYLPAVKYGITADSCYDERLDITLNTNAALSYLDELHKTFRTWDLAVTAYCCGPASLYKAGYNSSTNSSNNFDSIYHNLTYPEKDCFYRLLAITKWMEENETIDFSKIGNYNFSITDTVLITSIVHFDQIAEVLNINSNKLKEINPIYIGSYIDGRSKPKIINLPESYKVEFNKLYDSILVYKDSIYFPKYVPIVASSYDNYTYNNTTEHVSISPGDDYEEIKYTIVSGDNLGTIAERYDIKTVDLQDWNNIRGTNIYAGQVISIWVKKEKKEEYTKVTQKQEEKIEKKNPTKNVWSISDYKLVEVYEVQPGDSPYGIAKNYSWASQEDIMMWNDISDPSKLQVGQKLKIFKKK